ncbi:MAG: hypothetical protein HY770_02635 [Chitinivibrionia bacterium]|nr:hypothetical protein [Chitinivibrionia bacterium]
MNTGWEARLAILRQDAESKMLVPLRTHNWTVAIEREVENGEYLIINAKRGGIKHCVAIMYTSGTKNTVYKPLARLVEHIFINGDLYKLDSYAHGIEIPVSAVDDFPSLLVSWNSASTDGKFAAEAPTNPLDAHPPKHRALLSETPIEAIWLRLRQLTSVTLARKLVETRAFDAGLKLDDLVLNIKAEGLAFALRNAIDYFHGRDGQNVSQRVLSLYYGSMSFAFSEMLAAPMGSTALAEIEESTKLGHGLYTVDGEQEGLEHIVVGPLATGFFPNWLHFIGLPTDGLPKQRPKRYSNLAKQAPTTWATVEDLFARIPEVADLFAEIFDTKPAWVTPIYDADANPTPTLFSETKHPKTTYAILLDSSARLTKEDIVAFPGPISQITEVASRDPGRHFRVAVDSTGKDVWWDALPIHHSPFTRTALIVPVFGVVGEYRAICIALLYALSIIVRYRPSVWRRVQEGDLDHLRVLIEAFLAVVERVLPEQFLEHVTGHRVFAKQPGAYW